VARSGIPSLYNTKCSKVLVVNSRQPFCYSTAYSDPNAIAFVIAHEIGHKIARHLLEANSNLWFWLRGRYNFSHSQQMELEADYIGLQLMTRACYNPQSALKLFEKLEILEEEHGLRSFHAYENTHPPHSDRAAQIEVFPSKMFI